jgi:hypothetical protein
VAAEILRCRVDHHVHSHLDGLDIVRRCKRGVDNRQDIALFATSL